jgi:hypothetical protein
VDEIDAKDRLLDAVTLWDVRSTLGAHDMVQTAADALAAGVDSPALRELAGLSADESYWTLRPLIEATLDELAIDYPERGGDAIQIAAARVMSARLLAGGLSARHFATWAHRTIGHEGASRLQPIVELDDAYDDGEYAGDTGRGLDDAVRREAASLLAEAPPSGRASTSPA